MNQKIEQATTASTETPGPKSYRAKVLGGADLDVSPSFALFDVDERSARDILKFAALVKANDIYKIERLDYRAQFVQYDPVTAPEDAEDAGEENAVRTECDCLVVTEDDFFFRAYVKHTDVSVECEGQSIESLAKHFGLPFSVDPSASPLQKYRVLGAHPNRNFFALEVEAADGVSAFGAAAALLAEADEEGAAEFYAAIPAGSAFDFPGESVVSLDTVLDPEQADVFGRSTKTWTSAQGEQHPGGRPPSPSGPHQGTDGNSSSNIKHPWVIVTGAGTDDQRIYNDYPLLSSARIGLQELDSQSQRADIMKRLDDGTLTTEY